MKNILADDKSIDLSLKKIIQRVKKDNVVYSDLTETLLDGEISLQSDWPSINDVLTYISFGITILNTIGLLFLFYKFKTIATALMMHKAVSAQKFYYTQPTTTIETNTLWDNLLQESVQWDHFTIAILIIMFLLVLLICKKLFQISNNNTSVYVEIATTRQCISIKILDLPLCLTHWDITPPAAIDHIALSGTLSPKLIFSWHNFLFTNKITFTSIQVPGIVPISYLQALKLKRILSGQYCAYIIMSHQHIYYPLKPKPSSHPTDHLHQQLYPNAI
jgi:hypothetical protein